MSADLLIHIIPSLSSNCSVIIPKHPAIEYFIHQIETKSSILTIKQTDTMIILFVSSSNKITLRIPIVKRPIALDEMPFNANLGLELCPIEVVYNGLSYFSDCFSILIV